MSTPQAQDVIVFTKDGRQIAFTGQVKDDKPIQEGDIDHVAVSFPYSLKPGYAWAEVPKIELKLPEKQ